MARVIFEELAARLPRVHEKLAELAAEALAHINQVEQQMLPEPDFKPAPWAGVSASKALNRRDLLAKHFEREAAPTIEFARQISDPPGFEGVG